VGHGERVFGWEKEQGLRKPAAGRLRRGIRGESQKPSSRRLHKGSHEGESIKGGKRGRAWEYGTFKEVQPKKRQNGDSVGGARAERKVGRVRQAAGRVGGG